MGGQAFFRKRCPGCGADKDLTDFRRNAARPDGLSFYCKDCFKAIDRAAYERRRLAKGFVVRHREVAPDGFKWCADCASYQPLHEFALNRASGTGRGTYCKSHTSERNRKAHFVLTYGMSVDEVAEQIERQAGLCVICLRELGDRPHVDHDHATGEVRGVLCFNCNGGLGQFRDDADLLTRAAGYLRGTMTSLSPGDDGAYRVSTDRWRPAS